MTFQKGKSGNPGGRPKHDNPIKRLAKEHSPAAINKLVELMQGDDPRVALGASNAILDRAYGKPPQTLTGEDGEGVPQIILRTGVPQPGD